MAANKAKHDVKLADKNKAWEMRIMKRMTQDEIAKEMGVTQRTISTWLKEYLDKYEKQNCRYAERYAVEVVAGNDKRVGALNEDAMNGDMAKMDRIIKLNDQSLRILGAYAPDRIETTQDVNYSHKVEYVDAGEVNIVAD